MSGFNTDPLQIINLITDNLRDRYESGFPVLKEIVQNADDAGGKEAICLEFGLTAGLGEEARHPLLKGPGLFFLNDGNFKESDDRAIRSFGLNQKAADTATIGKFGLGMKSVFHFCEAFFYLAQGEKGESYRRILNPWAGDDEYLGYHPSWEEFTKEDQERLLSHLALVVTPVRERSKSWFLLWLPLRQQRHLEGKGGIITEFPGDDSALLEFLKEPDLLGRLAELLPLLRRLASIRFWQADKGILSPHAAMGRDSTRVRVVGEGEERELKGAIELVDGAGGTRSLVFVGQEQSISSAGLRALRDSPHWPRSFTRDINGHESEELDKAVGHAAVLFSRRDADDTDKGNLRIRWSVFLPMERGEKACPCIGKYSYLLTLHGYFFVDAGRVGIDGMVDGSLPSTVESTPATESDLRKQWNAILAREAVFPLILPSLDRFARKSSLTPEEIENLCLALKDSQLIRKNKDEICGQHQYVRVLTRSTAEWRLLSVNTAALPLPAPPPSDRERPWVVFPALDKIRNEFTLVDCNAPLLRSTPLPQWDELLLGRLLDALGNEVFGNQGRLDYFLEVLKNSAVRPFVGAGSIQQKLRRILAQAFSTYGDDLSRLRQKVRDAVSLVGKENRFVISKASGVLRELQILDLSVLLVPKDYDATDAPGGASLTKEEAVTLLRELDRLVIEAEGKKDIPRQDDCRDIIVQVLKGLSKSDREMVLRQNRTLRLIEAHDLNQERRRAVSLDDLEKSRSDWLLFLFSSGTREEDRLGLATLLHRTVSGSVLVILTETAQLLFDQDERLSPCTAKACVESLGRGIKKLQAADRGVFIKRLAGEEMNSEIQRRGMRYLLHGEKERFNDIATPLWVRGHEVSPAWEEVWRQIQRHDGSDDWNLLRKDLIDQIALGKWDELGIKEIRPKAILDELKKRGCEFLDGSRLSSQDRFEILAAVSDEELWYDLPLHEDRSGALVRVTSRTYLKSKYSLPEGLYGSAVIIKQSRDERVKQQQGRWLRPLDRRGIAELALRHEEPHLFWRNILEVVEETEKDPNFTRRLQESPWLPDHRGHPVKPEDVIFLPEIEDELDRLAARKPGRHLPPSHLHEDVRKHLAYKRIESALFSGEENGIECLALMLGEAEEYRVGEFSAQQDDGKLEQHLNILTEVPDYLHLPGWRLLQRLTARHGLPLIERHLRRVLFRPVYGQSIVGLLGWLKKRHEEASRDDKSKLVAVYNWVLTAFARLPEAEALLPDIFLTNLSGQWRMASELCVQVEGIAGQHVLDNKQKDILWGMIAGGGSPHHQEITEAAFLLPWVQLVQKITATPGQLRSLFSGWKDRVLAEETIGFLLCLLGNDQGMLDLAEEYRGAHDLKWFRDSLSSIWQIPTGADKEGRFSGLTGLTAHQAIAKHWFIVEVTPGDKPVDVVSLTGGFITVATKSVFETLVVGGEPFGYQKDRDWPPGDKRIIRIGLRQPDSDTTPEHFSTILKRTTEYLLSNVYEQRGDIEELWVDLNKSDQLDIRVAQSLILENIPFYLRMLSVHGRPDQLRELLQRFEEARKEAIEYEKNPKKAGEFVEKKRECLEELQCLLRTPGAVQEAVHGAVCAKMKIYQYEPASVPFELFQNADDATAEQAEIEKHHSKPLPEHCRRFLVLQDEGRISFVHWGRRINSTGGGNFPGRERGYDQDMAKMLILSSSDKESGKVTGKFGLGFKSVLLICEKPRLVSGRVGFEVVAGMCPINLAQKEELRSRLKDVSVDGSSSGTIVDLALKQGITQGAVMDEFCRLAGGLAIFSRQIRAIEIRCNEKNKSSRAEWKPEVLREGYGCTIELGELYSPVEEASPLSAIYFRCGNGGLLLQIGPRGFEKLPQEMPAVWVVAPTKEEKGVGLAVNGEFDLDAGRAKLSGTSQANREKAQGLGKALADGFAVLFDLGMGEENWRTLIDRLHLNVNLSTYDFWLSFWSVIIGALGGQDSSSKKLLDDIFTAECGLGAFLSEPKRAAVPTGLWGSSQTLTRPSDIQYVLDGLLDTEDIFTEVTRLPAYEERVVPGETVSREIHDALRRVLPKYRQRNCPHSYLRLQTIVDWVAGDQHEITPSTASDLGAFLTKSFFEQNQVGEGKELLQYLRSTLVFQACDGKWVNAEDLLSQVDHDHGGIEEEIMRAAFAPAGRLLSGEYRGRAVEFFRVCRERVNAPVSDLAAWVCDAQTDVSRQAALVYLRDGELADKVCEQLRRTGFRNTWLEDLENDSPYLQGWSSDDIAELLLRKLKSLEELQSIFPSEPVPLLPTVPHLDPKNVLRKIHEWWQSEWKEHLLEYEQSYYPGGSLKQLAIYETGGYDRSEWLTLFLLGAFHTIGRTRPGQHRGFIELCKQRSWWEVFSADCAGEQDWASKWMAVLDDFFDKQIDTSQYEHWMNQFPTIYRLSRHLDDYVEGFSSMNRHAANEINIRAVIAPRSAANNQGGGIAPPPICRTLGMGVCFVIRELMRKNVLSHPDIIPYCYVPVGRIRDFFSRMGLPMGDGDSYPEQSKAIYSFLVKHLGESDATFQGHYDIPLHILAEKKSIQIRLFRSSLDLGNEDENDY